ncbi:uncharacterized protein LOC9634887 [Selaginella moellendorffii]|uniref:uncharacterized protein LOC9634887 n=1 Tax=Selaginella moellendorffii TaxID=88036 RepID=UPI000D1CC3FC|nr:uncharacterized protein LOC9634887 [Selaginella moellendorffii]XP_024542821.1 uncharacterized protein LOC9634887 [Selaginella moellendorffii]|eukprot:XP_024542820.1 uncharacterized protein LOC9634887 [Selaginella moellendorffii]
MRAATIALWRASSSIHRGMQRAAIVPQSQPAALLHCRKISEEARKYRVPTPMAGWARGFPRPKGVEPSSRDWRRKSVKVKKNRRSFCPYTIKARRVYSRVRFEAQERRLKRAADREAAAAAAAAGNKDGGEDAPRMDRSHSEQHFSGRAAPGLDFYSRFVKPSGRTELVPAAVAPPNFPAYCKPVVKKIDSWRAPWTRPFKKPRQEYQVGRPRPLPKAAARAVRSDREVAKVKGREKKLKRLARGKIVNPKQRMEYT